MVISSTKQPLGWLTPKLFKFSATFFTWIAPLESPLNATEIDEGKY
jgi:hypothetical protein